MKRLPKGKVAMVIYVTPECKERIIFIQKVIQCIGFNISRSVVLESLVFSFDNRFLTFFISNNILKIASQKEEQQSVEDAVAAPLHGEQGLIALAGRSPAL
jgi:hypothetical protein